MVSLCKAKLLGKIVYTKTDDIYIGIAEDVETRFDISNYESFASGKPLSQEKIKKVIGLMKDELA